MCLWCSVCVFSDLVLRVKITVVTDWDLIYSWTITVYFICWGCLRHSNSEFLKLMTSCLILTITHLPLSFQSYFASLFPCTCFGKIILLSFGEHNFLTCCVANIDTEKVKHLPQLPPFHKEFHIWEYLVQVYRILGRKRNN